MKGANLSPYKLDWFCSGAAQEGWFVGVGEGQENGEPEGGAAAGGGEAAESREENMSRRNQRNRAWWTKGPACRGGHPACSERMSQLHPGDKTLFRQFQKCSSDRKQTKGKRKRVIFPPAIRQVISENEATEVLLSVLRRPPAQVSRGCMDSRTSSGFLCNAVTSGFVQFSTVSKQTSCQT